MKRLLMWGVAAAAFGTLGTAASAAPQADSAKLRQALTVEGILAHERALQAIANQNGGTRASGTKGYKQSVDYVVGKLKQAGYQVHPAAVRVPVLPGDWHPRAGAAVAAAADLYGRHRVCDGNLLGQRGRHRPARADQRHLDPAARTTRVDKRLRGRRLPDAAPAANSVALIQRGTCTFQQKAENAAAAGYKGVIIFNEGQVGRQDLLIGTLGAPQAIPVVFTSFADGAELYQLAQADPVRVHLAVNAISETRTTRNVIADTAKGRIDRVVVVGGHLDSVIAGPGINDNGSGTSTILEIALQMARLNIKPLNKVRFAFWRGGARPARLDILRREPLHAGAAQHRSQP